MAKKPGAVKDPAPVEWNTPVIAFGTLKGGVGKSMMTFNIAGVLAETKKVLLIDIDPQCNLSHNCNIKTTNKELRTVFDLFNSYKENNPLPVESLITTSPIEKLPNLDIIPSSLLLYWIEESLYAVEGKTFILSNFIYNNRAYLSKYDYIIIDTNPSMSIFNRNAFVAADSVILCTDADDNALDGAQQFLELWQYKLDEINKSRPGNEIDYNVHAMILNNIERGNNNTYFFMDYIRSTNENEEDYLKMIALDAVVPHTTKFKETVSNKKPINILAPKHKGCEAIRSVIDELTEMEIL